MKLFPLRRSIERLRDGLFDSVAISRLNIEEEGMARQFSQGLSLLDQGQSAHLCICGSYGQGKSHNLSYLNRHALSLGYVSGLIQLDIRETPFHAFSLVYRSLMEKLALPDGMQFADAWRKRGDLSCLGAIDTMPHRFQMILKAMLSTSQKEELCAGDLCRENCAELLDKALMGHAIPLGHLKKIFKSKDIKGVPEQSLVCQGNLPYVQMVQSLGKILKFLGYKGLVLLFDEAESIAQARTASRAKSYEILNHFFQGLQGLFPIFAFTEDFFYKVHHEDYNSGKYAFSHNYAETWKNVNIIRLQDFSPSEWEVLQHRLTQLYAEAYRLDLSGQMGQIREKLHNLADKLQAQGLRCKLKAWVNQLDIETQVHFLGCLH